LRYLSQILNLTTRLIATLIVATGQTMNSADERATNPGRVIRYAVVGDSYSIGEGATPAESWPALLARSLTNKGVTVNLVANPARTGWTTLDALEHELPIFIAAKPDFATLQIGVNDWVQGVEEATFRERLGRLIDQMGKALSDPRRLLIVNIPDFSVTPEGPKYARGRDIAAGLTNFNRIISEEANKRGLTMVDIFSLSQKMRDDPTLIAADGLHPSARAYEMWERAIFPAARTLIRGS
jgi:lysophospholipase L1-like esterase